MHMLSGGLLFRREVRLSTGACKRIWLTEVGRDIHCRVALLAYEKFFEVAKRLHDMREIVFIQVGVRLHPILTHSWTEPLGLDQDNGRK